MYGCRVFRRGVGRSSRYGLLTNLPGGPPRLRVVRDHSHRLAHAEREGVGHLNSGSAGPKRGKLPVTATQLYLEGGTANAEFAHLVKRGKRLLQLQVHDCGHL